MKWTEQLLASNEFKSLGSDGLPPKVLKELRDVISEALTIILRTSGMQGKCQKTGQELALLQSLEMGDYKLQTVRTILMYIDLSEAFDKVDHYVIFDKMEQSQMDNTTTRWIHSWLNNHIQWMNGATFT